jgi:hypothetical protein
MRLMITTMGVVMWANFLLMESTAREKPLSSREVCAAEERPAGTKSIANRAAGSIDRGRFGTPGARRPATDHDYWRWYGATHVGDRPVDP